MDDYFTPEINSQAIGYPAGEDWKSDNAATMQYDSYKVHPVLNEIDGYNGAVRRRCRYPGEWQEYPAGPRQHRRQQVGARCTAVPGLR